MPSNSGLAGSPPTPTVDMVIPAAAICRARPSKSPGFDTPSVRTMMCFRSANASRRARYARSSGGYMLVSPPAWIVPIRAMIFCRSVAGPKGAIQRQLSSKTNTPTWSRGPRVSTARRRATLARSMLRRPTGPSPIEPEMSSTRTMARTGRGFSFRGSDTTGRTCSRIVPRYPPAVKERSPPTAIRPPPSSRT